MVIKTKRSNEAWRHEVTGHKTIRIRHLMDNPTATAFVRYWSSSGHWNELGHARRVAIMSHGVAEPL
jgi:hypothetical protein